MTEEKAQVSPAADEVDKEPTEPPRRTWPRRLATSPATVAIVTWLVATPLGALLVKAVDPDPFSQQGAFLPLGAGGALLVAMTAMAWRKRAGDLVPAVAAGLFAAWVALMFRVVLNGTPFGTTGLGGDRGRMAAAATRFTVNFWSTDQIVEGIPAEYPPLYPWLTGHAARILGVQAWRLLAFVEVGVLSLAVLVGFLMWRRLLPNPVALALAAAGLFVYGDPRKAFAVITLFVFIPWVISSFANPPRGRLHWLPAGVIGGLIMLTYNGWFPFAGFGVFAIMIMTWIRSSERARYLWHVLLTGAIALIVSAPYLVPYFYTSLTKGGQAVSDLWLPSEITTNGFPFLRPTLLAALEVVGLLGLLWYRGRHWWSWSLLYLVLGAYAWWLLLGIRFIFTGHTTLFYYAHLIVSTTLVFAGILTLVEVGPVLARRLAVTPPYRTGAAALALLLVWLGFSYYQDYRPYPTLGVATLNDYSTMAHLEPLPDCSYTKFAPRENRTPCYPVDRIKSAVAEVRGTGERPDTLASEEKLFAYLPWRGYLGTDRTAGNTLSHWDDRLAEVVRISGISDPDEFAKASASTRFGPIDVFVMNRLDEESYSVLTARFRATQFDPAVWQVTDLSPDNAIVVAVRRPV